MVPYTTCCKVKNKYLIIKAVTMDDTVMGWFLINQYDDKYVITIANLVETMWLTRYLWSTEITYYQGSEFISNEFK